MEEHVRMYKFLRPILGFLYKLWYNPKIIGKENIPTNGSALICSNHIHLMDQCSIIISTKRMIHYMAKKEYFDGNFAWFFKATGCISVNRSIHDNDAKDKAINLLKNGYMVGIFPEGTRNRSKNILLPFKYGAVSMAKKTNSCIVPVAVSGQYKFRSKNLIVKIGKTFKVDNLELSEANNLLRDKILELLENNQK